MEKCGEKKDKNRHKQSQKIITAAAFSEIITILDQIEIIIIHFIGIPP